MLRVLSLNIWGLNSPLSRDLEPRVRHIADELANFKPDIAAFQEVWTETARDRLIGGGKRAGLQHVWHNPAATGGSGLLVLSRFEILRARFYAFELAGFAENVHHADYYGGKGFVDVELSIDGQTVSLLTTHLVASYSERSADPYVGHRIAEVLQIAEHIRGVEHPLIATGDFNFRERYEEYRLLTSMTGLDDAAAVLDKREDTVLADNTYRSKRGAQGYRIDYFFSRPGRARGLAPHSLERVLTESFISTDPTERTIGAPSDHAGLFAEFDLVGPTFKAGPIAPDLIALAESMIETARQAALKRRGQQRGAGAAALLVTGAVLSSRRQPALSRRQVFRVGAIVLATVSGLFGSFALLLSEGVRRGELQGLERADARLASLADE